MSQEIYYHVPASHVWMKQLWYTMVPFPSVLFT